MDSSQYSDGESGHFVTLETESVRARVAGLLAAVVYYLGALLLALALIASARAVSDGERALSRLDSAEERTDTLLKGWMETLSLGFYDGARDKAQDRSRIERSASSHRRDVAALSWVLGTVSGLFLLLAWLMTRAHRDATHRVLLHLHGVAGICLLVGLLAPMLSVVARSEVAVLGRVVLQFEAKGILDTVCALIHGGNLFTGVLLALFSVLVPVGKLSLSFCALLWPAGVFHGRCLKLVKTVGKWSMTDVFVVAILLAFLALGDGALTDARLGPGLYYFAAYGLLSFAGGMALAASRDVPTT